MNSKSVTKNYGTCLAYVWKNIECELCHTRLPEVFISGNQVINLVDIPTPKSAFLTLESLNKEKQTNKIFYVISFENKDIIKLVSSFQSTRITFIGQRTWMWCPNQRYFSLEITCIYSIFERKVLSRRQCFKVWYSCPNQKPICSGSKLWCFNTNWKNCDIFFIKDSYLPLALQVLVNTKWKFILL